MSDGAVGGVTERFFRMLGLARRAGKTVLGTEMICEQMRAKRKPVLVLVSREASEGTRRRLINKSHFYGIEVREIDASQDALAKITGHAGPIAGVAVTDEGFAKQLLLECH